jgi:hypothetical protein
MAYFMVWNHLTFPSGTRTAHYRKEKSDFGMRIGGGVVKPGLVLCLRPAKMRPCVSAEFPRIIESAARVRKRVAANSP